MPAQVSIAVLTMIAVLLMMAGEAALSAFNERVLRQRGGIEAEGGDDMHAVTLWVYPLSFIAMSLEGALTGPSPAPLLITGLAVFGSSKALKMWVVTTLGIRWTFRVLVLPGTAPVVHGPYAILNHPNYIAVIGEMVGVALIVWAPITGAVAIVGYSILLRRKSAIEDRALGRK